MPIGIAPVQAQKKKSFIDTIGDVAGGIKDVAGVVNSIDTIGDKLDASGGTTLGEKLDKTPTDAIKRRFTQIGLRE